MRVDPILLKRVGRAGAFALIGAVIIAASVSFHHAGQAIQQLPIAPAVDPLAVQLKRCGQIVRPEDVDDACRAAWADVRRRFFETDHGPEVAP